MRAYFHEILWIISSDYVCIYSTFDSHENSKNMNKIHSIKDKVPIAIKWKVNNKRIEAYRFILTLLLLSTMWVTS